VAKSTNRPDSQQTQPILQRERPLVSLEEYAVRYGLSRAAIDDFAKMGIIQIRKFKGKTYVVDVPISPYAYVPETPDRPKPLAGQAGKAPAVSQSVKKTSGNAPDIKGKQLPTSDGRTVSPPAQLSSGRTRQIAAVPKQAPATHQPNKRHFAAVMFFLIVSLIVNLWLYIDRMSQVDKLSRAEASIQHFLNLSVEANRKAKTIQSELAGFRVETERLQKQLDDSEVNVEYLKEQLVNSRAENRRLQNELYNSTAKLEANRNKLTPAQQNREAIQQQNAELAAWLNEQIQKLENQKLQPTGDNQISPGP